VKLDIEAPYLKRILTYSVAAFGRLSLGLCPHDPRDILRAGEAKVSLRILSYLTVAGRQGADGRECE